MLYCLKLGLIMNSKKLNPSAITALKQALANIYWYKRDLRTFLNGTLNDKTYLSGINWENYKQQIADDLVNILINDSSKGLDELLRIFEAVSSMRDFSHFTFVDDGENKRKRAILSVEALRKYTKGFLVIKDEKERIKISREEYIADLNAKSEFKDRLSQLNFKFKELLKSDDKQARGFQLEEIMNELFNLFDLDPKASFRTVGEQIDGAFTFENCEFIFEAKWKDGFANAQELDALMGKVQRRLDNTLGLFLSINGFSDSGITAHASSGRKLILLMDGEDLMAVLDGRIDFKLLLKRKKREAAQKGNIYLKYRDMI